MEKIRLQKYFTDCGVLSRRAAEEEIKKGRVKVNGVVAELGQKITPGTDLVEYAGKRIMPPKKTAKVYLMLHKPRGFVTTVSDELGRRCVTDLVKDVGVRVFPVGRLDKDTEGLLLITNDGDLAHKLLSPKKHVQKVYHVTIDIPVTSDMQRGFAEGDRGAEF